MADKSNIRDTLTGCFGWLAILLCFGLYIGFCSYCSHREKEKRIRQDIEAMEKRRSDSIRAAFVKDSIEHTPAYIDSVARAKEEYQTWKDSIRLAEIMEEKHTPVAVVSDDSVYHTSLSCISFEDRYHIKIISIYQAKSMRKSLCEDCENINNVYEAYEYEELIHVEDAMEYIRRNYSDNEIKDYFDLDLN